MSENDVPKIELKIRILSFLHNNTEVEIILCLSSITLIGWNARKFISVDKCLACLVFYMFPQISAMDVKPGGIYKA